MNQESIEITNMTIGDLDEVVATEIVSFSRPWSKDVLARELQIPISRTLVARIRTNRNGQIGGYLIYWVAAGELQVHKICVREDLRRRGIASLLMAEMIRRSSGEGVTLCSLEVGRSNEGAKRLYEKFGFHVTDVRLQYYPESGEDAMVMYADMKKCLELASEGKI